MSKELYKNTLKKLFETVTVISICEKIIIEKYNFDEMKTPMHMSFGDENCIAGVVESLRQESFFFGYYRSHSLYLAISKDPYSFFAELLGKKTGSNGGIAGSMHMSSLNNNLLNQSAIVASTLPLSLGAALANKSLKKKEFTTVFFGDGALEEGVSHETLNMASLYKLPILFVCLDNDLAVDLNKESRQGIKSIEKFVKSYNCEYLFADNPDAMQVYIISEKAKKIIRKKNRPIFLHLKYYRYLQHIGIKDDFENNNENFFEKKGYRSKRIHEDYLKKAPNKLIYNYLINNGFKKNELDQIIKNYSNSIKKSFNRARKDEFGNVHDLRRKIFYESNEK